MSPTLHQEGKVWTSEEGQDGQEAGGGARGGGRQSFPRGHRRSSGPCEPRVPSSTVRAPMRRVRGRLPSRLPASLQGSKAPTWSAPKPVPQPLHCPVPTMASPASTELHMQPRKKYHGKSRHVTWGKPTNFINLMTYKPKKLPKGKSPQTLGRLLQGQVRQPA